MALRRDTDYAIRLLVFYGQQSAAGNGYVYRREAIRGSGVPAEAQARLCRLLREHGYLRFEKRERSVGYRLALPPEQITIKQVIELMENSTDLLLVCDRHESIYSKAAWSKVQAALDQHLEATTIRDLME